MAKDMADKDNKIKKLTDTLDKCYDFLKHNKLFETFMILSGQRSKSEAPSMTDWIRKKKKLQSVRLRGGVLGRRGVMKY